MIIYATCVKSTTFFKKWEVYTHERGECCNISCKNVFYTQVAYIIFCNTIVPVK